MCIDYYMAKERTSDLHRRNAIRLYDMFIKNKGIYIKTGQQLGQSDHWIPQEYLEVFEPLYTHIPTSPFEEVKEILEFETGKKMDEMFSEFEETPIASASMA